MAVRLAPEVSNCRRLALVLANGAYTQRAPLSRTIAAASELQRKLECMGFKVLAAHDQALEGMRTATHDWLRLVEQAVELDMEENDAADEAMPLMLFFTYCGHGSAGRFFPVDCPKQAGPDDTYCFYEDMLFRLYEVLAGYGWQAQRQCLVGGQCKRPSVLFTAPESVSWQTRNARIIMVIESCRRLKGDEKQAYEQERARVANSTRHMLPSLTAQRPDLAPVDGAAWDATRLGFLSRFGSGSPHLLLALSSESTSPSYDVVFLRSIIESIDKPVRLGGILERACLDTLRRTGHKQKPVVLTFGGMKPQRGMITEEVNQLQEVMLATPLVACLRNSNSVRKSKGS